MFIYIPPTYSNPEIILFILFPENFTLKYIPNLPPSQKPISRLQSLKWLSGHFSGRTELLCMGTDVILSKNPNLLETYCSISTPLTVSQPLWPQQPASSSFFFQMESRNGVLGLWDLITEQNLASFNSVMDLGFHYYLCKERFHRKHHQKERWEYGLWNLLRYIVLTTPFPFTRYSIIS